MRKLLNETFDEFKKRFEQGFHDAHFLSIEYDFNAGNPPYSWAHRVSVKISTPDWINYTSFPAERIILLFEMEGFIDYISLKKQENSDVTKLNQIDILFEDEYILLDFHPYSEGHPLRGQFDIYKHYEKERLNSLFVLKGKKCFWSIID